LPKVEAKKFTLKTERKSKNNKEVKSLESVAKPTNLEF
jgi:hypothetical protein